MLTGGVLLVVGLALIICGLVVNSWDPVLWVGVSVATVGLVMILVDAYTRRRRVVV